MEPFVLLKEIVDLYLDVIVVGGTQSELLVDFKPGVDDHNDFKDIWADLPDSGLPSSSFIRIRLLMKLGH